MKKMLSMLMILALLLGSMGAVAQDNALSAEEMEIAETAEGLEEAEEIEEIFELHGEIIEMTDEYVLISTPDMGDVQVNLSEDTVIEGVDALEIGQTAVVMYNGMMTRSLPPQITALHIGVYAVSGVIAEVLEDRLVIVQDETGEEIILMLPGSELLGENEELLEDEAMAELEESEEADELSDDQLDGETDEEAEPVDEELTGEEVLSEEALNEELSDEELLELEAPVYNVGDAIIAYTNGAMTMSLPPQMTALAIVLAPEAMEEEIAEMDEAIEGNEATEETEEIEEAEADDGTVG